MGVDCCKVESLPHVHQIIQPQTTRFPSATWVTQNYIHPVILRPLVDGQKIYARPLAAAADSLTSRNYVESDEAGNIFLHAPGTWALYNNSGQAASWTVEDAFDTGAALSRFIQYSRFGSSRARADGFVDAKAGRRFATTHQTPGTAITGQTSFVATTPTLLFHSAALNRKLTFKKILLCQVGVVAGGTIEGILMVDTADRYSAGGTALTPQNVNADDTTTPAAVCHFNPTATAAGAGTRYIMPFSAPASLGAMTVLDLSDAPIIGLTGSLALYTWAAVTGPTWRLMAEHVETM